MPTDKEIQEAIWDDPDLIPSVDEDTNMASIPSQREEAMSKRSHESKKSRARWVTQQEDSWKAVEP